MMPKLWLFKNINWDSSLPDIFIQEWQEFVKQLEIIKSIKIPRLIGCSTSNCFVE